MKLYSFHDGEQDRFFSTKREAVREFNSSDPAVGDTVEEITVARMPMRDLVLRLANDFGGWIASRRVVHTHKGGEST